MSAIKVNEPIGDASYGPFFLRIVIGAYFVLAGLTQIGSLDTFIEGVKAVGVLQGHAAAVYAVLLPYVEIFAGALLLLGFWTNLGALLASVLLCSFIYVVKIFPFASNVFNKDIIVLAGTICLMYTGAGAFSIDKARS